MHDFFVYDGKNSAEPDDRKFGNLQKYAQIVAKICDNLLDYKTYKVFFDKWFTRLNLLYHFRPKEIHAVGTIQLNRLQGGLLDVNIDLPNILLITRLIWLFSFSKWYISLSLLNLI